MGWAGFECGKVGGMEAGEGLVGVTVFEGKLILQKPSVGCAKTAFYCLQKTYTNLNFGPQKNVLVLKITLYIVA